MPKLHIAQWLESTEAIGVALSVLGNLSITVGLNLQKHVHNKNQDEKSYTKIKLWWVGMILMAMGECGNFLAYGYASATVVAPLGSVSVVANAFGSHIWLKEPITQLEILGLVLAVTGSTMIVLNAPKARKATTMARLLAYAERPAFLAYLGLVVAAMVVLIVLPVRYKRRYVVFYVLMCALLGSITVCCTEGVSTALVLTGGGDNQFLQPLPYILIIIAAGTIFFQIRFLNAAMSCFGASSVVPVYYVLFTFFAISAGIILLEETEQPHWWNNVLFVCGCLVTFVGVFAITKSGGQSSGESVASVNSERNSAATMNRSLLDNDGSVSGLEKSLSEPVGLSPGSPTVAFNRRNSDINPHMLGMPTMGLLSVSFLHGWSNGNEGELLDKPVSPSRRDRRASLPESVLRPPNVECNPILAIFTRARRAKSDPMIEPIRDPEP